MISEEKIKIIEARLLGALNYDDYEIENEEYINDVSLLLTELRTCRESLKVAEEALEKICKLKDHDGSCEAKSYLFYHCQEIARSYFDGFDTQSDWKPTIIYDDKMDE